MSDPTPVPSVYVHAPFCARRCIYCDFAVKVSAGDLPAWLGALRGELEILQGAGEVALAPTLETLYVGGGTPSLLGPDAMRRLAELIGPARLGGPDLEWTVEANPESFDAALASGWRAAGVNRVSLGVQSFHEPALRWMGRMHGADGADRAVDAAKAAGFTNVSVDLIFGLPAHLGRSWRADLERVLALEVAHVSLYGLGIEARTPLGRAVAEGRAAPVDEEQYEAEFLEAAELLTSAGYEHYEVSNFCRPGLAARHNAVYWDGRPYLGLGNGAHGYVHPVRRWNVRDWDEYVARCEAGRSPEEGREVLDAEARRLETVWLGLRTLRGVPRPPSGTGMHRLVDQWIEAGWAREDGDRVRLTTRGWLLLDRLAVELAG